MKEEETTDWRERLPRGMEECLAVLIDEHHGFCKGENKVGAQQTFTGILRLVVQELTKAHKAGVEEGKSKSDICRGCGECLHGK